MPWARDELNALWQEHEEVHFFRDPASGLRAIVAIHDTSLGPALGGIRCAHYTEEEEGLLDVLRLSKGMTRKNALAGLPAGGGKALVFDHDGFDRERGFSALGGRIEALGGRFFTSGDFGTSIADLRSVARGTRYVTDPDRMDVEKLAEETARGVFLSAGVCLDVLGIDEWKHVRIAIQGLGKTGLHLATLAARAGASVLGADVSAEAVHRANDSVPITIVSPDELQSTPCELYAPCARGGVLTAESAQRLQCRLVVGSANNQLDDPTVADVLHERGILLAPDFIANAGAVLIGSAPALEGIRVDASLDGIVRTTREVVLQAVREERSPYAIALERADERWQVARAARR